MKDTKSLFKTVVRLMTDRRKEAEAEFEMLRAMVEQVANDGYFDALTARSIAQKAADFARAYERVDALRAVHDALPEEDHPSYNEA